MTCRECGGTLSDTAAACPHCGAVATHAGRRHGWMGKLYIGLCYLAAAMFAFTALLILVMPFASEPRIRETAEPGMIFLSFGAIVALAIACARGVQRFRRWGWWLAMGVSAVVVLSCIGAMLMPTEADPSSVRAGGLFFIAVHAPFLAYFWSRRRDFTVAR
jgi:amino acid transporter